MHRTRDTAKNAWINLPSGAHKVTKWINYGHGFWKCRLFPFPDYWSRDTEHAQWLFQKT